MIKMGCLLFGLCVVLCFVPDLSPMLAQSETLLVIEECDFADKASSSVPGANGLVVWFEIAAPCRKRRPYRNPLRKLRKRLRHSLRQARRRLKKKADQRSSKRGKTVDEPNPNSTAVAVENVEKIPERNKLGRPATIVTDHVFCPTETCPGFHVMGPHPDHWIVGAGTFTTIGGDKRQMFECQWCHTKFSETRGTVFFGLKTPSETVYRALACLAEGMGIRATARVFQVKKDTVLRWLRRAGQHSAQVSDYLMRNLQVEQAQLDELWTFVLKKEKALSAWEKLHSEYGDNWTWTAVDPVHKLVLAFLVGDHEETEAVGLLKRLKAVLPKGCMPLFTSDQLPH